jgi:hypothetical protein
MMAPVKKRKEKEKGKRISLGIRERTPERPRRKTGHAAKSGAQSRRPETAWVCAETSANAKRA